MPSSHFLVPNLPLPPNPNPPRPTPDWARRGQTLAILAIMFFMLLAFVGMATDAAILYATYGTLRRAVDAGSLNAAAQLRDAASQDKLDRAVQEIMALQGLKPVQIGTDETNITNNIDDDGDGCKDDPVDLCIQVEKCDLLYGSIPTSYASLLITNDPVICTYPVRKLVRVEASTVATFAFMRLFGFDKVRLDANATSEAAALDVVLVLDLSYSMTYDVSLSNGVDDDGDGCTTPIDEGAGSACQDDNIDNDNDGCIDEFYDGTADGGVINCLGDGVWELGVQASDGIDNDSDGCFDEQNYVQCPGDGSPEYVADDWLGSRSSVNGQVRGGYPTGNTPADLPNTTPNCTTAAALKYDPDPSTPATKLKDTWQAATPALLPADITYDIDGNTLTPDVVISPLSMCRPFEYVRDAAIQFTMAYMDFPYDRVGIVTFASAPCLSGRPYAFCQAASKTALLQSLSAGGSELNTIRALSVGNPNVTGDEMQVSSAPPCHSDPSKQSLYPNLYYGGDSPYLPATGSFGECENTDTGDGLKFALNDLTGNARSNAVRIVILLSDGAASTSANNVTSNHYACPLYNYTAGISPYTDPQFTNRNCQDGDARNNYIFRHAVGNVKYDADDYARDQADAISTTGNILMYTIGLGTEVTKNPNGGTPCNITGVAVTDWVQMDWDGSNPNINAGNPDCLPNGEQLLRYIADQGDGVNLPDPDPCRRNDAPAPVLYNSPTSAELLANPTYTLYLATIGTSCGNYFYAQGGADVQSIFDQIAKRIFTRLTQ